MNADILTPSQLNAIRISPDGKKKALEILFRNEVLQTQALSVIQNYFYDSLLRADQDLHQDIFIDSLITFTDKVQKGKFKREGTIKISSFIISICKMKCKERLPNKTPKKLSQVKTMGDFMDLEGLQSTNDEENLAFETNQSIVSSVKRVLSKLDKKCIDLLIKKHLYNWKIKEIASDIKLATSTVNNYHSPNCEKKFRTLIKADKEAIKFISKEAIEKWAIKK